MTVLDSGISVIIPTFRGAKYLPRLLASLAGQTVHRAEFEIVVVLNGPEDGSRVILQKFQTENPTIMSRVLTVTEAGAGIARNVGLANARREFVTFVDDDDYLQPVFLERALQVCTPNTVALMSIVDEQDGDLEAATSLNLRIRALSGRSIPLASAPWVLGFNSCKVLPTEIASRYRYDRSLKSGEDVAFFAHLLRHPELRVSVPREMDGTAYIRVLRKGSVSRREDSFEFSVRQRLQVISALQDIHVPPENLHARRSLELAQFEFLKQYLPAHSEEYEQVIDTALELGVKQVPWKDLRPVRHANRLVISFCFPPYADPAANVVAKRIASRGEVVDVISGSMDAVRGIDQGSLEMVEPWMNDWSTIDVYPSFSEWPLICQFATRAIKRAKGSTYQSIYSRALWSGSHVAGLLYKVRHPGVHWQAEFSDPMRFDASGTPRAGEVTSGRVTRSLRRIIARSQWPGLELTTHFELTEAATFIAADEVIFSNENQKEVMLEAYPQSFRGMVESKSYVEAQPVPPASFYSARSVNLRLDPEKLNFGYFGNFYKNRGLETLTVALSCLVTQQTKKCVLHVFSSNAIDIQEAFELAGILGVLQVHEPLPYLDFLNATRQFDALIVVDTDTSETCYTVNPFLPSKYADYLGSGVPVWAMVEVDSTLHQSAPMHVSHLHDVKGACRVLSQFISSRG